MSAREKIRGISVSNPVIVDRDYLMYCVNYAVEHKFNHIQIIGPIHEQAIGNLDGMTEYRKYSQFNKGKDFDFIKKTMAAINEATEITVKDHIRTYVWHHELELPDGFGEAFPEALNEFGDFEVTHPAIKDFLENKIIDFFAAYPGIDGIVLTLHETKVPLLKLKSQKLGRTERVKYVTGILYDTCKKLGKELVVRPFASIEEDYTMMMNAYEEISPDLVVMDKWTQFDWSLCLPHNKFFYKIRKNPLMAETDIFGEFFGKGRVPLMLLDHIREKVEYCESFPVAGYCSRIDRDGKIPFGDVNEVNLNIMNAAIGGEDTEKAAREFFEQKYPGVGNEMFDIMRPTEELLRKIIYLKGYYYSELSFFPQINHSKNHFYFEMMRESFKLCSGEWFIPIGWERGSLDGVFAEKAEALEMANDEMAKIEALRGRIKADDYDALHLKFRNLQLVAEAWWELTHVFLYYVRYFETKDASYCDKLEEKVAKLEEIYKTGRAELGDMFYCFLGENDEHLPLIPDFVSDVRASFKTEREEVEATEKEAPLDYVICGGGMEGHCLMKEVNFSDTGIKDGKLYRIPGNRMGAEWSQINAHGWFSYELKVRPNADNEIVIDVGSITDKLVMKVTVGTEETVIREPIFGTKTVAVKYHESEGKDAVRIRIDRLSGDTPCVYRIMTR